MPGGIFKNNPFIDRYGKYLRNWRFKRLWKTLYVSNPNTIPSIETSFDLWIMEPLVRGCFLLYLRLIPRSLRITDT